MGIDFGCRKFDVPEVVRCGLGLSRSEFRMLARLAGRKRFSVAAEARALGMDRATVQRAAQKFAEKGLAARFQRNLKAGGYVYEYEVKSKAEVKAMVRALVSKWSRRAEDEIGKW